MRTYAEETDRLDRELRSNGDVGRTALEKTERELRRAIDAILAGVMSPKLKERVEELETHRTELNTRLSKVPAPTPKLRPNSSSKGRNSRPKKFVAI